MKIDLRELDEAVREIVDQQCGLEANTYSIDNDGKFIRVRAKQYTSTEWTNQAMELEWKETAEAIIKFLEERDLGKYELRSVNGVHCHLEREEIVQ